MRTTLDIEPDILQAAKEIAAHEKRSTGKVLSELARKGLKPKASPLKITYKNGVPVLPDLGEIITMEHIQKIMDEEQI